VSGIYTTNSMEATRYVAEHSRANIMVVEDEEQYAKVGFILIYYIIFTRCCSVVDLDSFNQGPDPAFQVNTVPDPVPGF
jgi:hypothetical protein